MDLSGERGRVSEPWEQVERDLNEFPARQKGWEERIVGLCIFGQLPLIFLSLLICMVHLERLQKSISSLNQTLQQLVYLDIFKTHTAI